MEVIKESKITKISGGPVVGRVYHLRIDSESLPKWKDDKVGNTLLWANGESWEEQQSWVGVIQT